MQYGLIGEKLPHSFSKEIHAKISDYLYDLVELDSDELDAFMRKKNFLGINVTIPYKQAVIKYLDEIDESAKKIGSVNTVVNKNGRLCGYNTDYFGMKALIMRHAKSLSGQNVLILGGDGGTAKTAYSVCRDMGAKNILRASREKKDGFIDYVDAENSDVSLLINATPVGMYPKNEDCPIDISKMKNLSFVIDAIYNPVRTNLILKAKKKGIPAEGGLYMLVCQAVFAAELFLNKKFGIETAESIFRSVEKEKENIYLIGMPGAGKSEIGKRLSQHMNKPFFDSDAEIVEKTGMEIRDIFAENGENTFRKIERDVISVLCREKNGAIISTGGGAILSEQNIDAMKRSGKIYFLNRDIDKIVPTDDRPLSQNRESLKKLFEERYDKYLNACDRIIDNNGDIDDTVNKIEEDFLK